MSTNINLTTFWNQATQTVIEELDSSNAGLTETAARQRLSQRGIIKKGSDLSLIELFLSQFKSPLVLLLIFAAVLSFFFARTH